MQGGGGGLKCSPATANVLLLLPFLAVRCTCAHAQCAITCLLCVPVAEGQPARTARMPARHASGCHATAPWCYELNSALSAAAVAWRVHAVLTAVAFNNTPHTQKKTAKQSWGNARPTRRRLPKTHTRNDASPDAATAYQRQARSHNPSLPPPQAIPIPCTERRGVVWPSSLFCSGLCFVRLCE